MTLPPNPAPDGPNTPRRFALAHGSLNAPESIVASLLADLGDDDRASCLGLIYATGHHSSNFDRLTGILSRSLPAVKWVGAFADAIVANDCEYISPQTVAVMLLPLPPDSFAVFSGDRRPDMAVANTMIHVDPDTPEAHAIIGALAGNLGGELFGGMTATAAHGATQLAHLKTLSGGLSGVGFNEQVQILSSLTQGCRTLSAEHEVTASRSLFVMELDGRPALDVLLEDLDVEPSVGRSRDGDDILRALPAERLRYGLLVGLAQTGQQAAPGFGDYRVVQLAGIDPENRLLALAVNAQVGERLVFCTRDRDAARHDLVRVCTELREQVESEGLQILGVHFVSCVARGIALFGCPGTEAEILRHNLGNVPVIGFYANGEIAGHRLYGFTAVITLFVAPC